MTDKQTTCNAASPLLSTHALSIATAGIAVLAIISLAINFAGQHYGHRLALADHSDSTAAIRLTIGRDTLQLPENTLRFADQRQNATFEQIDLYLSWPELRGYETALRDRFNSIEPAGIIFLQITQSTMTRDMSGRLEPIYRQLLTREPAEGRAGLDAHRFRPGTGYEGEILFTGRDKSGEVYAVRCLDTAKEAAPTNSDCQRDIHLGRDMSVLYRFPISLLPQWRELEASVRAFILSSQTKPLAEGNAKLPSISSTKPSS